MPAKDAPSAEAGPFLLRPGALTLAGLRQLDAAPRRKIALQAVAWPAVDASAAAAALASENKTLAHPASVDSLPTSANQEDYVSMATWAARKLCRVADNTAGIVAIELLAAAQGIDFRKPLATTRPWPRRWPPSAPASPSGPRTAPWPPTSPPPRRWCRRVCYRPAGRVAAGVRVP